MKRKKTTVIIVMCVAMLFMAVGYALLSTRLNINGSTAVTSSWRVEFTAIRTTNLKGGATNNVNPTVTSTTASFKVDLVQPGDQVTYEIDITNFGDIIAEVKGATYSINGSEAIYVDIDGVRKGTKIGSCEGLSTCPVVTMTIKVGYDPAVEQQPEEKTKTIDITLDIGQYVSSNPTADAELVPELVQQNDTLVQQILRNNTAQSDGVIDFTKSNYYISSYSPVYSISETGTLSGLSSSRSYCFGTGYTFNSSTGTYTLSGASCGTLSSVTSAVLYGTNPYTCQSTSSTETCFKLYHVTGTSSTTISYDYYHSSSANYTTNGQGLYYTSNGTEGGKTTYYFRGMVFNNYVEFADKIWRIVRINEDGSVRLILNDQTEITGSKFNETVNDNAYAGYMYGTPGSLSYADTHKNTNDSTLKGIIDDWYVDNLSDYTDYLDGDAGFCNDRSVVSGLGYGANWTSYGAVNRVDQKPQFVCPNNNDLFTTSTSNKGNKALTYPIGLLTVDEANYAGLSNNSNHSVKYVQNYLLRTPSASGSTIDMVWLMSPSYFNATERAENYVIYQSYYNSDSYSSDYTYINDAHVSYVRGSSVKPVINLKGDVLWAGGNGSSSTPYTIKY